MAEDEKDQNTLPLVLIHREPIFNIKPLNDLLAKHFRLIDPHHPDSPHSLLPTVRAAVIIGVSQFSEENLLQLPSLELVAATSAGTDHIDIAACRRRGIVVTGIGDSFTDNVADLAVGLLIDVLRRVSAADRFVRSGSWPLIGHYPLGSKIGGKRVGIVGLGKIGSATAKRLAALGCKIYYNSRNEKSSAPYPYFTDICDLALESDILVVCCALTDETRHIIDRRVMGALGNGGVIINVGRGALVDEPELVGCLRRGDLKGVGLDVFENEPHVPQELLELDNVVLSPHAAVVTPEAVQYLSRVVLGNLVAFFSDKLLISLIE